MTSSSPENTGVNNKSPDVSVHPDQRMRQLVDQSLVGLMFIAVIGLCALIFRVYQFGVTPVLAVQFVACSLLFACLYFRRRFPQKIVLSVVVAVFVLVPGLALARFGLVTPALVVILVFPIIIGGVSGLKPALLFASLMLLVIIAVGVLFVTGIIQPGVEVAMYMTQPVNWVVHAMVYAAMVLWGAIVASRITEYWRASVIDVKNAEAETLREREVVATLQRQQSMVQLSGGVAHDFNNILAAITISLEIARDHKEDPQKKDIVDVALNDAMDAAERGAELTKSLRSFAKAAVLEPRQLNLNDVIERSVRWIGRTVQENIKIEIDLTDDLKPVYADEASLSSALLNLIINARDAMPEGGHIEIKTQNLGIYNNEKNPFLTDIKPGQYVELTVTDSGTGIALSEQIRIFEPFYSTKEPGAGSGLGLAMVQGFMKQSGGTINVSSEPGSGASFCLLFRAEEGPVEEFVPDVRQKVNTESSGACVMIVEDEELILKALKTMLDESGYEVRTAGSGDEAWSSLRQDATVDLVLSDEVMPGKLQGTGLARNIQDAGLNLPVILMSGYTYPHTYDQNLHVVRQFLDKPIRKNELIETIEEALPVM